MTAAVLVTGGAGYIGSHACKALARAGYLPVVYDNLCRGHRSAVKWGPFEGWDLADKDAVRAAFTKYPITAVLHFAAHANVGESMDSPDIYFRNNVVSTLNLLDVMVERGVTDIVFSSTCAVYGIPDEVPISERHPQNPVNPYGESKRAAEAMLRWYGEAYGLRFVSLRYFNAAGADAGGEIGEDHEPETHLIPLAIEVALGLRPYVEVYGTDYLTPDGTAIRDYVHVSDLADAHVQALEYLLQDGESTRFNLGTNRGYTVREVIGTVERISGITGITRDGSRRTGDPPILVADASKAKAILGWCPRHSDLDTIVQTAFAWHRSRLPETEQPVRRSSARPAPSRPMALKV